MTNTHIEASRNLLTNCSIETTPNVYAKYGKFSDLVDKEFTLFRKSSYADCAERYIGKNKRITKIKNFI